MKSSVRINKKSWVEVVNRIDQMRGKRGRVGLFDGELALIGLYHEFGTETIQARPWLRSTFAVRRDEIAIFQARILKLQLEGKLDADRAMRMLGEYLVSLVRENIIKYGPFLFVPLKAATIAAKGGKETPLIHTGQMVNSITYKIVD